MARWLRMLLPALVVAAWLAAAGLGGPTFGKLSDVSTNDQAGFLPASAESTTAGEWQERFRDSDAVPAIAVVEFDEPIQPQQLADYAPLAERLADAAGLERGGANQVVGPIPSEDFQAVQFIVPVPEDLDAGEVVTDLRAVLAAELPESATGYVTGPAGFIADLVEAFGGIDGLLLGVALGAVFVILLLVYRALLLPFLVLLTSVFALCAAILVVYWFALQGWIQLSGQSQGILSILVIGAATDYALLLTARYREALGEQESKWAAMKTAYRGAVEPIAASGATVILALLCLLFSDLNSNRSLGPIAAIGIVFAVLAALTFLPAVLLLTGRSAFWPIVPRPGHHAHVAPPENAVAGTEGMRGLWLRVANLVARMPRATWMVSVLLLVAGAMGVLQLQAHGVPQSELVLVKTDSADGQDALVRHFDAGAGSPAVVVADSGKRDQVLEVVRSEDGVASAEFFTRDDQVVELDGRVMINATLQDVPDSDAAEATVADLRTALDAADPQALVGGVTAVALDTNVTAQADLLKITPMVLGVILLILILLLRSILAPVLLILSVALSYLTALGVSALVFNHVFGFPGADATVPLYGFVFLVALGIDYNIFLMTRVREESLRLGTRPGILRGLGSTGGVITSAGVVLAATFAALGVIPILFLGQLAFIVAFGVLLDTVLVRSLLIPALSYDIGPNIWWPSKLARKESRERELVAAGSGHTAD
ncbi:MMPL family transporter [Arthrobacter sulfonylureivorans]|uniref:MMPL family transporter n=1 Tax=Arthrobacter sulfonylureivorans TaxID=2486855 RepID=A0ABY3WD67_9MICC|nr:MMPL family transporter [Arthrobacter sulfonylureivorans]UNK46523.1 MMPL family transporter [Arthrobacter sulfonylureivorans]